MTNVNVMGGQGRARSALARRMPHWQLRIWAGNAQSQFLSTVARVALPTSVRMLVVVVLVALVLVLSHAFLKWTNGHWRRRGVKQLEPTLFYGNFKDHYQGKECIGDTYIRLYNTFSDKPWFGAYFLISPQLVIRDPAVVKDVFTTHFNSIHDNDFQIPDEVDPILSRDPFFAIGDTWKRRRTFFSSQLTPAKVKSLFPRLLEVCQEVNQRLESLGHRSGVGEGLDTKDLTKKFMVDIVAASAFGLKGDTVKNDDSFFNKVANELAESFANFNILASTLFSVAPRLARLLGYSIINKTAEKLLRDCVKEQSEIRGRNGFSGPDFMSTLLQKRQQASEDCNSQNDVLGFLALFFMEGYEAPSNALTYTLLEIANDPDIQTRLRAEINEKLPNNADISYDAVISMEFLDQVFNEAFRLHPGVYALMRRVTKPVKLTSQSGDEVDLKPGDRVTIPLYAFSMDPNIFSNPHSFDPSRFTEEGKKSWPKGAFTPFGDGPRACPGIRFTNAVLKSAIVNIVRNFKLELGINMTYPITLQKSSLICVSEKKIMIRMIKL